MSHFTVMVAVPGDRIGPDKTDVNDAVEQILAKYNEQDEDYCVEEWSPHDPPTIPEIAEEARRFVESGRWTTWVSDETEGSRQVPKEFTAEQLGNDLHMVIEYLASGDMDYWKSGFRLTDEGVLEERHYYNPDAQWDWWVIGGRWRGYFMLKPEVKNALVASHVSIRRKMELVQGGIATVPEAVDLVIESADDAELALMNDYAFLGDPGTGEWMEIREGKLSTNYEGKADAAKKVWIDFDRMREEAAAEARLRHGIVTEALAGRTHPSWTEIRERWGTENIDLARSEYNENPVVKEMREKQLSPFMEDFNDYWCLGEPDPLTAYVDRCMDNTTHTYAFIDVDGEWKAPGQMGWFASSTDTAETREAYRMDQTRWVESLPDDTWLVVVDCHI